MAATPEAGPVQTPWVRRFFWILIALGALWIAALVLFGALATVNVEIEWFVSMSVFVLLPVFTVLAGGGYLASRLRQGQHDLRADVAGLRCEIDAMRQDINALRQELDERDGKLFGYLGRRLDMLDAQVRRQAAWDRADTEPLPVVGTAAVQASAEVIELGGRIAKRLTDQPPAN